jgi:predicted nucleic acid-binding protein
MAIDRWRRAAEIEVDPGRIQAHRLAGVFGHQPGVGTEQLQADRRAGRSPAAIEQFRADALEGLGWQDIGRHPDKFADTPVVAAERGQHAAQHIVGEPFHRGEKNTGHEISGQGIEVARIIIRAMLRLVLDTNVVLDLFHWANTDAVPIMAALESGQIECFVDERTLDELQRVLTYPQLKMTPEMIVERYARYSRLVQLIPPVKRRPCRAARTATTRNSSNWPPVAAPTLLVSKDKALLRLRGRTKLGFQILKPEAASALLQS